MNDAPFSADWYAALGDLKTIGRYEIGERLGQGASGVVFKGFDPYIKRPVAIKLTRPGSERARERFFREAQYAGRLSHPNLVMIYDVGIQDALCYFTMAYVNGSTLEKFCHKDHLLPVAKVVEIIFKVCDAIDYAHREGIIHRDIKPQNIMLDEHGDPKIADFGIAQMTESTSEMGVWGTPSYMAPEQLKEEAVSNASDIFSLGCVLYELLTGVQAFSGRNNFQIMYKIINEEPAPLRQVRPELPVPIETIVCKTMAKDPRDRYQSGRDLAYDLRAALRHMSPAADDDVIRDAVDYVNRVPFFHNFSREQVRALSTACTIIKAPREKRIVTEGEIDDTFFIILSGKARIVKDGHIIARVGTGECFGEMAYIAAQPRTASVVADTDCVLMKISAVLMDRSPENVQLLFFRNFAMTLVRRLSNRR